MRPAGFIPATDPTPAPAPTSAPCALLGVGSVRHTRVRPVAHEFVYPTWFVLLPLRTLRATPCPALRRNRFGWVSFHDRDHGDGRADSLAWIDTVLARENIHDADGEVWLHCYPRVLGFAFKPVSFWYCHRADATLAAIVVEVNNTFGERHCYLLAGPTLGFGRDIEARKVFHVSPFCSVAGRYRFRFMRTDLMSHPMPHPMSPVDARGNAVARTVARIAHHDADGLLLRTSVSGTLAPLTAARLRSVLWGMPLLTLGVIARIHWQALQLWCKRVPFRPKPVAPTNFITR